MTRAPSATPRIGVVLPAEHGHEDLRRCLEGFARQTVPRRAFEVLVVGDSADAETVGIVRAFRSAVDVRVERAAHHGVAAARNAAIALTRSPLLILYDDGLSPAPALVSDCLDFHRRHPAETDAALLSVVPEPALVRDPLVRWLFEGGGGDARPEKPGVYGWRHFSGRAITCKTRLLRRERFNAMYLAMEDTELAYRIAQHRPLRIHVGAPPRSRLARRPSFDEHFRSQYTRGYFWRMLATEHPDADPLPDGVSATPEAGVIRDPAELALLLDTARRLASIAGAGPDADPARFLLLSRLWWRASRHAFAIGYGDASAGRWLGAALAPAAVARPRQRAGGARPEGGNGVEPRAGTLLTIGLCTVSTRPRNYLLETLTSVFAGISARERAEVGVFVQDCDVEPQHPGYIEDVKRAFAREVRSGLLTIERVAASRYPAFDRLAAGAGDGPQAARWRAKFTYDFSLIMERCRGRARYYLHLEDDVVCARGFYGEIKRFIASLAEPWSLISFSDFGFVGKCLKDEDLGRVSALLRAYFDEMPADWLIEYHVDIMRRTGKPHVRCEASLFDHIGTYSSLPGKMQPIKSRTFVPVARRP
jgi:hypothetical protein